MADANYIITALGAMAKATQASLKLLMEMIEYRQLRNQLVHDVGSDDNTDVLLQKVADNMSNRQAFARVLAEQLQESCSAFLDYLDSFSSPVTENEVSLSEKQVDLFVMAYDRDHEVLKDVVRVPVERLEAVISRLESMPEREQMGNLVEGLKKWERTWNVRPLTDGEGPGSRP